VNWPQELGKQVLDDLEYLVALLGLDDDDLCLDVGSGWEISIKGSEAAWLYI
jgi:hypothetical protein